MAGFTINSGNGVITAAAGIDPGFYSLIVEVTNNTGTAPSAPFDWEIELFYLPPQWTPVQDQIHGDDELQATLDLLDPVPYVTTNSGPLTSWVLLEVPVALPPGFSITAGVIEVAFGTAPGSYDVTVSVSNDEGAASSASFAWTISIVLLPPQWTDIPDQTTREDDLTDTLDASLWVSSNSGTPTGWELVSPPTGFSIDADGLISIDEGLAPN